MKPHVFISYAREDREFASSLHAKLEKAGLAAWLDAADLPPSAEWRAGVENAIEAAGALAFVVSPSSVRSEQCLTELRHGRSHGKAIFLVVPRWLHVAGRRGELAGALVVPVDASVTLEEVLAGLVSAS
jgi:isopentenyl diphosphate isomerase/L-lactate dehydrogenase-like FMN-dependent dehydrogenase